MSDVGLVLLSNRECAVLLRLAIGESFKAVGDHLGISRGAALAFAGSAYLKLGVHDRGDAFRRHGFHKESQGRACYSRTRPMTEAEMDQALALVAAYKNKGWRLPIKSQARTGQIST